MDKATAARLNVTSLAYIGDAAYELAIRQMLIERTGKDSGKMHHDAIKFVSSTGQSLVAKRLCSDGFLSEEEEKLLKRARNHRSTSKPHNADPRLYKWATGFEALIGYLYLSEDNERLQTIIAEAVRIIGENRNE